MTPTEPEAPSPADFAAQLIAQLFADLHGVLSLDDHQAAADGLALVAQAAREQAPRGAGLYVLVQAAHAAHQALVQGFDGEYHLPADAEVAAALGVLIDAPGQNFDTLRFHARRLLRYAGETEPAAAALPLALAQAMHQLYEGMAGDDPRRGLAGLTALRALVVHVDAIASLLDPAQTEDRPVRVFAPDRFHDYFLDLTERVKQAGPGEADRAVAALTRDGRLTAVITAADHPLEAAAQAVRERVAGDATTREHALLRMQGLLRHLESLRQDRGLPMAEALDDQASYLALVTAAATAPMAWPGHFAPQQLLQVARYNRGLLAGAAH